MTHITTSVFLKSIIILRKAFEIYEQMLHNIMQSLHNNFIVYCQLYHIKFVLVATYT